MLLTTIFPSIRFCLTVVFPVMFPMNFRYISDEFPAEFPQYITMVWYLCLVKGGDYPGFVAFLDGEMKFATVIMMA